MAEGPREPGLLAFLERSQAIAPDEVWDGPPEVQRAVYDRMCAALRQPRPPEIQVADLSLALPDRVVPLRRYRAARQPSACRVDLPARRRVHPGRAGQPRRHLRGSQRRGRRGGRRRRLPAQPRAPLPGGAERRLGGACPSAGHRGGARHRPGAPPGRRRQRRRLPERGDDAGAEGRRRVSSPRPGPDLPDLGWRQRPWLLPGAGRGADVHALQHQGLLAGLQSGHAGLGRSPSFGRSAPATVGIYRRPSSSPAPSIHSGTTPLPTPSF